MIGHVAAIRPRRKPAVQAGDKIVRLDGKDNPDWEDILTKEIAQRPANSDGDDERNGKSSRYCDARARRKEGVARLAGKARTKSRWVL